MHQDRDARLAVEIVGHVNGPVPARAGRPELREEAGKSCPEHGGHVDGLG